MVERPGYPDRSSSPACLVYEVGAPEFWLLEVASLFGAGRLSLSEIGADVLEAHSAAGAARTAYYRAEKEGNEAVRAFVNEELERRWRLNRSDFRSKALPAEPPRR